MKAVLLIIAHHGFQPIEYGESKRILENFGREVITASDQPGNATDALGGFQSVDLALDVVRAADYDGIFFIGGPGAFEHLDNEISYRIIREAAGSGRPWGAICIAPRILVRAGVLKGKKATGWNDDGKLAGILEAVGATYINDPVVTDGLLITADGPAAAASFGQAILDILTHGKADPG